MASRETRHSQGPSADGYGRLTGAAGALGHFIAIILATGFKTPITRKRQARLSES
jgi:hypothetical protein